MSKVIGIVSEGPTDYLVLKAVIDKITGETRQCYGDFHNTAWSLCYFAYTLKSINSVG